MGTNRLQKSTNRVNNKSALNNDREVSISVYKNSNLEYKSRVYCKLVEIDKFEWARKYINKGKK